jgi:arylformamidase
MRRSTVPWILLIVGVGALCGACVVPISPSPTPTTTAPKPNCATEGLPSTVAYRAITGVDPNLLSLDIHAPAGACNAPVVMWVHGGGYQEGDKSNQMADKVSLFNGKGWLLVSVNYRLTVPGDLSSAHYPDQFDDVAASIAWVKTNIGRYGGDPSRVALLGHSAGADIVSNVASNPSYLASYHLSPADLRCVGPLDTEGFDKPDADASEQAQWQEAFGNDPNYKVDTSASLLIKPNQGMPPTIGVYRGTATRQSIEKAFIAKVASIGVTTDLIDARSLTHAEVNSQIGAPGDDVMTAPLVAFLSACLA